MRKSRAMQLVLNGHRERAVRPSHQFPVIFVCRSASQADLIVTAFVVDARPREAMSATLPKK